MTVGIPEQNLGTLEGPVLAFGGPYSNLAATEAMRRKAEELAIPPERVICDGDVVAYCAEPCETLRLVRDWGIPVVMGNCEDSLAQDAPDCGCGFEEGTACSLLSVDWYRHAAKAVGNDDRRWMAALPRALGFELNGRSVLVVHGGVRQINRFLFPSTPQETIREELDLAGTDLLIGGHSGIPGCHRLGGRAWLNAGAIGLPANDGTRDGWYLLIQPQNNQLLCRWQRLEYDAGPTMDRMRGLGFLGGYRDALRTGLWPSMDVLPAEERARRGQLIFMEDLLL